MWEHKANQGKDPDKWKENMKQLCKISTVEDFWRYFQHLPKPSQVFFDGDCRKLVGTEAKTIEEYSFFKNGIEPEWGDPQNLTGGEWFCRQYLELDVLDLYWQRLPINCFCLVAGDSKKNATFQFSFSFFCLLFRDCSVTLSNSLFIFLFELIVA